MITNSIINSDAAGLLANKFFIIAAMLGLATKHNDEVILPKDMIRGLDNWQYGHIFQHQLKVVDSLPTIEHIYQEPMFQYNEIPYQTNMDVRGYFQSEKYFKHCSDVIRHYFLPKKEIIDKLRDKYPFIWEENCVSMHFRRGDYLYFPHVFNPLTLDYYNKAIQSLPKCKKYLVFSNDIPWCKTNIIGENIIYMEGNENYEDLFLQSFCKYNITAASTFSWFAAWLNNHSDKRVVMPKNWFVKLWFKERKNKEHSNDLFPEDNRYIILDNIQEEGYYR